MGFYRVGRDANQFYVHLSKSTVDVVVFACLGGTPRSVVFWVKVQYNSLAFKVAQTDCRVVTVLEADLWSWLGGGESSLFVMGHA